MNLVPRPQYEERLTQLMELEEIKVITGVRRCGKSSLLNLAAERLRKTGVPDSNIYQHGFDEYGTPLHPTAEWLLEIVAPRLEEASKAHPFYLLLDEIQEVSHWQEAIRRLQTLPQTQILLTGSNAHVLSGDLATLIAGRYVELSMMPLSFEEYLAFRQSAGEKATTDELFNDYLLFGGMPGLARLPHTSIDERRALLSAIFDTVVLNDVATHGHIRDLELLNRLIAFTFSTSGNLVSANNICNVLKSTGRKVSPETVDSYLRALEQAYVVTPCPQTGVEGKEVLRPLRKLYPCDTGLRNLPNGFDPTKDRGFMLENVVFNELLRHGWTPRVGALPNAEVDFVATRGDERLYVQVSWSVADEITLQRELEPLRRLTDAYPRLLLTTDRLGTGTTSEGIVITNICDWLLGQ